LGHVPDELFPVRAPDGRERPDRDAPLVGDGDADAPGSEVEREQPPRFARAVLIGLVQVFVILFVRVAGSFRRQYSARFGRTPKGLEFLAGLPGLLYHPPRFSARRGPGVGRFDSREVT
jgi:hypothetical protein